MASTNQVSRVAKLEAFTRQQQEQGLLADDRLWLKWQRLVSRSPELEARLLRALDHE